MEHVKSEDARLKTNPRHKARLLRKQAQAEEYFARKVHNIRVYSLFLTFSCRNQKKKVLTTIVYKHSTGLPKRLPNGKPRRKNAKHALIKVSLITTNLPSVNTIDSPPPSTPNRFKVSNQTAKKPKPTWLPMLTSSWPRVPSSLSAVISPETRMLLLSINATIVSIKKLLVLTTNIRKKPKRAWNAVLPCKLECE